MADDLTPYCLRHTYATDLQSADVPINVAKDFLGHKSIAMTSHIYTHLSVDAFAEASLKVINFQHAQQRKKKLAKTGIRTTFLAQSGIDEDIIMTDGEFRKNGQRDRTPCGSSMREICSRTRMWTPPDGVEQL